MSLLPVADALALMLARVRPIEDTEPVLVGEAAGRILARPLVAPHDQPPFPASAMDGYAVRARDLPGKLRLLGEAAAGRAFRRRIGEGECCRIFTGAAVPDGADAILIQEDATMEGEWIETAERLEAGRYIRPKGLDYAEGSTLLHKGTSLGPAALALAASAGFTKVDVKRRPRVLLVMTGDELVLPGETRADGQIYGSNATGVGAIVRAHGGEAIDGGIVPDEIEALTAKLSATDADIVVTLGGASVGDHDLVLPAMQAIGVDMSFMKLAMRPGKPVMFGTRDERLYLGLPGNPVSSLVGARILLVPLLRALLGQPAATPTRTERLAVDLPQNGPREHYMRAEVTPDGVRPFPNQDSSLLSVLAGADCLLVRAANDPARKVGESAEIVPL